MNIIFLEAVQIHGGARKSTIELAKRLKEEGHNSVIVDFWGNCNEFVEDVQNNNIPFKILKKNDTPIAIFNSKNPLKIFKNITLFLLDWMSLKKEFDAFQKTFIPDVVIINNIKTNSILRRGKEYKIAYFARGWFAYNSISFLKKLMFKYNSDYFIGVSQSTRQAIYTGGLAPLEKIFVVPNAIDLTKVAQYKQSRTEKTASDPMVILHCGGFLPAKGQQMSVALAKKLKENHINFKMIFMGAVYDTPVSANFLNKIKNEINCSGLENHIEILLNHKDPYNVFRESDVLIHPSDTEGLPRVIMEALAFGMPVIANPVGGVTDYILHNFTGYIANHNDVNDYYDYITKLYYEPELYTFIADNGKALIMNNYTKKNQLEAFHKIFKKLAGS
ncbi:glycosyltransferase involved in cell wall biosynthesis [Chryseobacterium sp. SLBN-27]|uniref:glycosyltransferase family 4 protein n=1 Tax=Chryseobacterium sp. SLBN-27 TaxID=3042287 RepID=UPI002865C662|nr:glycosyltransferase family 4 protein [Chryseobacterium sp. SLBN-27]MDR6157743.1 glycosyltransferase involved in cell wall biosynthesis [Chryseobacterium sp. SLBN-27]